MEKKIAKNKRLVNGVEIETEKILENGVETVIVREDGVIKSKTVNGVAQPVSPTTDFFGENTDFDKPFPSTNFVDDVKTDTKKVAKNARVVNGVKTETEKVVENGVETVIVRENGEIKSKTVDGVAQPLNTLTGREKPSTSTKLVDNVVETDTKKVSKDKRLVNGVEIETEKVVENGVETITVRENGEIKSKIVDGVAQPLNTPTDSEKPPVLTKVEEDVQTGTKQVSKEKRIVNGVEIETERVLENGVETVTVREDGVVQLKTVNGVLQP